MALAATRCILDLCDINWSSYPIRIADTLGNHPHFCGIDGGDIHSG
jgi:hypothetical protein